MYLHLGDELAVSTRDLVGIFDIDAVTVGSVGREYLQKAEKAGRLTSAGENLPKSFIVCSSGGEDSVYLSPISAATLLKRLSRGLSSVEDINSEV